MMKEFKGLKKQRGIITMMSGSTMGITSKGSGPGDPGDPDITSYSFTKNGSHAISGNNHNTPYFNLPGTRVYFNRTSSLETWQYSMSTPGDMSTIAFELTHLWGTTQFQRAISFSPDRTKFYKIRRTSSGSGDTFISADPFSVLEAGDVAGGNPYTLTGVSALSAGIGSPATPIAFVVAANNLDLFVMSGDIGDRAIYHYQMSIAGDAGTAITQGQALDVSSEFDTNLFSIVYTPDGSKLFVVGTDSGAVIIAQYDMNTAYDVNTAVYSGKQITVAPAFTTLLGLFVWENPLGGFQFNLTYPTGGNNNGFNWSFDQYDTAPSAPTITDFSPASYSGDISASSVDPNGVFVDASGTRVFIVNGSPGINLVSYSMGVAFDLTTLSAAIATEAITGSPIGVFLKPDGTKLFVTTFSSQIGVREYTLSTPWDITTRGAFTLLATAGDGATIPFGLHFSPDGLNVYTSDNGGNLFQWSLAAPWDVSSPTFIGSFDFTNEVAATKGQDLSLSNDGTKLYLADINFLEDSEIFQYTLATPFDLTTIVFDSVVLTLTSRIGSSGFHMLDANNRFYAAYNGDAGGADPEAIEEFTI